MYIICILYISYQYNIFIASIDIYLTPHILSNINDTLSMKCTTPPHLASKNAWERHQVVTHALPKASSMRPASAVFRPPALWPGNTS